MKKFTGIYISICLMTSLSVQAGFSLTNYSGADHMLSSIITCPDKKELTIDGIVKEIKPAANYKYGPIIQVSFKCKNNGLDLQMAQELGTPEEVVAVKEKITKCDGDFLDALLQYEDEIKAYAKKNNCKLTGILEQAVTDAEEVLESVAKMGDPPVGNCPAAEPRASKAELAQLGFEITKEDEQEISITHTSGESMTLSKESFATEKEAVSFCATRGMELDKTLQSSRLLAMGGVASADKMIERLVTFKLGQKSGLATWAGDGKGGVVMMFNGGGMDTHVYPIKELNDAIRQNEPNVKEPFKIPAICINKKSDK